MASKIYTAQEMRDMTENITRVDVMDGLTCREHCYPVKQEVKSMLRHAAEALKMSRVRQGDKFRVLPLNALAAI